MNPIINKLTEIDSTANSIVEHATMEKEKIKAQIDEERKAFDISYEEETKKKIAQVKNQLSIDSKKAFIQDEALNTTRISSLKDEYKNHGKDHAKEIFLRIVGV